MNRTIDRRVYSKADRRSEKGTLQKKLLYLAIIALFIFGVTLIRSSISGLAKTSDSKAPTYKYYTSIVVEKGDSLWSIATEYITEEYEEIDDYIIEVRTLNHLYDNGISAGESLTIPYYSEEIL